MNRGSFCRNTRRFNVFSRNFAYAILMVIFLAGGASAQAMYTPEKGSAERREILDALRGPIEKELNQKVIFVVNTFNVKGTWAFVSGEPQSEEGGRPDYTGTIYQEAAESDAFDDNFFALLRKTSGGWKLVTKAIGCTDVCYLEWWTDYKAPKAIFGMDN